MTTSLIQILANDPQGITVETKYRDYLVTDPVYDCRPYPDIPSCAATLPANAEDETGTATTTTATAATTTAAATSGAASRRARMLSEDQDRPFRNSSAEMPLARLLNRAASSASAVGIVQEAEAWHARARRLQTESTLSSYLGEPPPILTFQLPAFKMARMEFDFSVKHLLVVVESLPNDYSRLVSAPPHVNTARCCLIAPARLVPLIAPARPIRV